MIRIPFPMAALALAFLGFRASAAAGDLPTSLGTGSPALALDQSVGLVPAGRPGSLRGGGSDYRAHFDAQGLRFEPALGSQAARTESLGLCFAGMTRGGVPLAAALAVAPELDQNTAIYARSSDIEERWELTSEGVELSFVLAAPPAGDGDLVARLALETSLPLPDARFAGNDALLFRGALGGVSVGGVTGVDAAGRSVQGELHFAEGALELLLPDAFLDAAQYPVVLDPLVGTSFGVSTSSSFDDNQPDLAYNAASFHYLVVWQRTFSANDTDIRGQRTTDTGALVGGTIFLSSSDLAANPAVANVNPVGQYAVTWQEQGTSLFGSTLWSIRMQTVDANSGALGVVQTVVSTTGGSQIDPDIGGQGSNGPLPVGEDGDLIVVWDDNDLGEIRGRHYAITSALAVQSDAAFTLATDMPIFTELNARPSISRVSGVYQRFLVVYERSGLLGALNLWGRVVLEDGSLEGSSLAIANSSDKEANADVDGLDVRFVVTWERDPSVGTTWVQARSVFYSLQTFTLSAEPVVDVTSSGQVFTSAIKPAVGFGLGKSFIGWRESNSFVGSSSFKLKGFNSANCTSCEGPLTLDTGSLAANEWLAVATENSGGAYYDDRGMVVWSKPGTSNGDVKGQAIVNNSLNGSSVSLGGACGAGGTQSFSAGPSIGTNWFIFGLSGLPSSCPVAVLNISAPGVAGLSCDSCVWTPFQTTISAPAQSNGFDTTANTVATIPCDQALVGAQFETQWTAVTPFNTGCGLFPGISLSDRVRHTIGN